MYSFHVAFPQNTRSLFLPPNIHPLIPFGHACMTCFSLILFFYFVYISQRIADTLRLLRVLLAVIPEDWFFFQKQWNHEIFASADIYSICMRHIYVDGLQTKLYDARNAFFCALWFLIKLLLNISVLSWREDPLFVVIGFRHINDFQYELSIVVTVAVQCDFF